MSILPIQWEQHIGHFFLVSGFSVALFRSLPAGNILYYDGFFLVTGTRQFLPGISLAFPLMLFELCITITIAIAITIRLKFFTFINVPMTKVPTVGPFRDDCKYQVLLQTFDLSHCWRWFYRSNVRNFYPSLALFRVTRPTRVSRVKSTFNSKSVKITLWGKLYIIVRNIEEKNKKYKERDECFHTVCIKPKSDSTEPEKKREK